MEFTTVMKNDINALLTINTREFTGRLEAEEISLDDYELFRDKNRIIAINRGDGHVMYSFEQAYPVSYFFDIFDNVFYVRTKSLRHDLTRAKPFLAEFENQTFAGLFRRPKLASIIQNREDSL